MFGAGAGPALVQNILNSVAGRRLIEYDPQRVFVGLIGTGASVIYGPLAHGTWSMAYDIGPWSMAYDIAHKPMAFGPMAYGL